MYLPVAFGLLSRHALGQSRLETTVHSTSFFELKKVCPNDPLHTITCEPARYLWASTVLVAASVRVCRSGSRQGFRSAEHHSKTEMLDAFRYRSSVWGRADASSVSHSASSCNSYLAFCPGGLSPSSRMTICMSCHTSFLALSFRSKYEGW